MNMSREHRYLRNLAFVVIIIAVMISVGAGCIVVMDQSDKTITTAVICFCVSAILAYSGKELYKKSEENKKPSWMHETWRV